MVGSFLPLRVLFYLVLLIGRNNVIDIGRKCIWHSRSSPLPFLFSPKHLMKWFSFSWGGPLLDHLWMILSLSYIISSFLPISSPIERTRKTTLEASKERALVPLFTL